jgi:hypothetical protein
LNKSTSTSTFSPLVRWIFYAITRRYSLFSIRYSLDPQFVDINAKIDGNNSSFSVPDIMEAQVKSFTNSVTGEEQDTKIQLTRGFIWKLAEAAGSKIMCVSTPALNFDDSGKNAFYFLIVFKGP